MDDAARAVYTAILADETTESVIEFCGLQLPGMPPGASRRSERSQTTGLVASPGNFEMLAGNLAYSMNERGLLIHKPAVRRNALFEGH